MKLEGRQKCWRHIETVRGGTVCDHSSFINIWILKEQKMRQKNLLKVEQKEKRRKTGKKKAKGKERNCLII